MSASGAKKQPTISKFFASLKKGGTQKFDTDEEKKQNHASKIAEVSISPAIKRTKTNGSVSKFSKKARTEECETKNSSSSELNGDESSTKKRSLTSWTKNRLQSFSADTVEEMEVMQEPQLTKPTKKVNQKTIKNKLDDFRSQNDSNSTTTSTNNNEHTEPAVLKPGPMKALPGMKLTPLEQQVVSIKNEQPDVVLFVECGYKYRFFGNDAEIAAKELNIVAHLDHSFMTASIPTHRLHVHVRRLVAKGYKVGVVKQTETAALKAAGSNKTAPFGRELAALYTRSTLIGEDVTPAGGGEAVGDGDLAEGATAMLLVVHEGKSTSGKDGTVGISIIAIQPSTGDIIYDTFDDSSARTEFWCRLDHIQPVEALVSTNVSDITVQAITAATTRNEDCIRIERLDEAKFDYSDSLKRVCELFVDEEERMKHVSGLPPDVVSCLGAALQYLAEFKLDRIIKMAGSICKYSSSSHYMRLSGATLRNLEVLTNAVDGGIKGSLLWALDKTHTKFGSRLLRRWIVQPLLDVDQITERQDMVEELMSSEAPIINKLKSVLNRLPDFERALTTIFHKKCSPHEFWLAVEGLHQVHAGLSRVSGNMEDTVNTPGLVHLLHEVLDGLSNVEAFADNINEASAREGKKTSFLKDFSAFPKVIKRQQEIADVEEELRDLKPEIAKILRIPSFNYTTVSGLEFLIEVKNSQLKAVPKNWAKISSTKACCRFRSPEIEKRFTKLQQLREQLQADCHEAWLEVLDSFSSHYQLHRQAVRSLATLDALTSLANVAKAQGYCRPKLYARESGKGMLKITEGRHPIVSQLKLGDDQYVANDTNLKVDGQRVMLVTGPNMGGKSCYMRQVALIALMSQTGSYVPAESVEMSILDAIYTRMGAADEIYTGRSTFMVEVGETADIMHEATTNSLVILDELGRGTSTHDGVAVAMAALDFFLNQVKCLTIFVTHYLPLTEFELLYPECVGNFHMSFIVNEEDDGDDDGIDVVTFLYQLTSGSAGQSYGLNVARLAQVPHPILVKASEKSKDLEKICKMRRKGKDMFQRLFQPTESTKELLQMLKDFK
nr:DNA mismatch repair protein Msh3-like [Procambarus clarkii]XP_045583603.1 DNA mismatch repair protein Msh3-like [Procambarus clarkii]XP_045583604.1 DNA mismatch repair protein Msh3-like [Procambarus clarkii]XP_045583605.1 DNA mismatch repair protein Msh3-like [Procambarus clarkii]XP_045583606.1 DNA mismatch repair protein Msh3-like [Procambarus clarkii]